MDYLRALGIFVRENPTGSVILALVLIGLGFAICSKLQKAREGRE